MKTAKKLAVLVAIISIMSFAESARAIGHPGLGRFAQRDPLGYVDGANLYEYVRSNPVTGLDPWGLARNDADDKDTRPVLKGQEIARGAKDEAEKHLPGEDQLDDGIGNCRCKDKNNNPTIQYRRQRPSGIGGAEPRPGQGTVKCKVGEFVLMKYPGECVPNNDGTPCECANQKCDQYTLYECKIRVNKRDPSRNETVWGDAGGTYLTQCANEE